MDTQGIFDITANAHGFVVAASLAYSCLKGSERLKLFYLLSLSWWWTNGIYYMTPLTLAEWNQLELHAWGTLFFLLLGWIVSEKNLHLARVNIVLWALFHWKTWVQLTPPTLWSSDSLSRWSLELTPYEQDWYHAVLASSLVFTVLSLVSHQRIPAAYHKAIAYSYFFTGLLFVTCSHYETWPWGNQLPWFHSEIMPTLFLACFCWLIAAWYHTQALPPKSLVCCGFILYWNSWALPPLGLYSPAIEHILIRGGACLLTMLWLSTSSQQGVQP